MVSQKVGAFWHFYCSLARLDQPAGAQSRLEQPGAVTHSWEEEGSVQQQPTQLYVVLSAYSLCVALKKL